MELDLTSQQKNAQTGFRDFVDSEILPHADRFDREERLPPELIDKLAEQGYLRAALPPDRGGLSPILYGLLNEEIARGCSSVRCLMTAHHMVMQAVHRWGSKHQMESVLPKLATGEWLGAFGLTEPNVGSDAGNVETTAQHFNDMYILNGCKSWVTSGQVADVFLIFAQCDGHPTAFLVNRDTPGLSIIPAFGMLGVRASMLAELRLKDCRIPEENLVGKSGFGFSLVATSALDHGRYSVAWGCVGIAQGCLDACLGYTSKRQQFGKYLKEHQLIQRMMAEMITNVRAARLLCLKAGYLRQQNNPAAMMETMIAKYFASRTAVAASSDAVQIHGAVGCSDEHPVQRYWRDSKIMEIIEGTTQIQQIAIAQYGYQGHVP